METRTQQGFTLISVTAAIVAVGLLSAVALPSMKGRSGKARLAQAVQDTSDCRSRVAQAWSAGAAPADARWGCAASGGRYVKDLVADMGGAIHIRVQDTGDASLDDKVMILVPYDDPATPKDPAVAAHWGRGISKWVCTGSGADAIPAGQLPADCRG